MEKEEELAVLDPDTILAKHVEQLEREKKELQAKLKAHEKKVDHFVRACQLVRQYANKGRRSQPLPCWTLSNENFLTRFREFFLG